MIRSLITAGLLVLSAACGASAWTERCDVGFELSGATYSQVEWRTKYFDLGDFEGGGTNVVCVGPDGGSGGCTDNNPYNSLRCDVDRRPFLPALLAVCSFETDDPEAAIAGMAVTVLSAHDWLWNALSPPFAGTVTPMLLGCD